MYYKIQNILFLNQDNTLYKVTLETGEIHYVVVGTDTTELGMYVNEKIAAGELIPQQYEVPLSMIKYQKQQQLQNDFNNSKKITIQNGNTLIIEHDTPERKYFFNKLKIITQESTRDDISITYQQERDGSSYEFSAIYTIWAYIFKDLFLSDRIINDSPTGFKEDVREQNQIKFNIINLQIQRATTHEELDAITWNFTKPNGIIIDVNNKAEQMLNDPEVSATTKYIINRAKDPVTGEIHLINKV